MKYTMLALILAAISWAQTAPTISSTPQSGAPLAKGTCCEKMAAADQKDAQACCARPGAHNPGAQEMASCSTGKQGASCCAGKNAKCSTKAGKDKGCWDRGKSKTAKACCGSPCERQCADGKCCGTKSIEKAASDCSDRTLSIPISPGTIFPW